MTTRSATMIEKNRPFSPFEFMVSWRYLRARREEAFISVIAALTLTGIAIGVATLIVVTSVMNGFRAELLDKILGLNGHFTVFPIEEQFEDYRDVVLRMEEVDGVTSVVAFAEGQALASGVGQSTGVSVRGMSLSDIQKLPSLPNAAILGGFDGWDDSRGVAIGIRLAQKLGVSIGDPVTIITPDGVVTPFGTTPQIRSYPVTVIFELGMVEFDSFFVFMPLQQGQEYYQLYRDVLKDGQEPLPLDATDEQIDAAYERIYRVSALEVFLDDPDATAAMRDPLQLVSGRPMIFTDWQRRNETFFSALQVERVVMFVILSMIVLVAVFNIISSLVMLVKEKNADIAVLRTIGATRASIMRIFCMTGTAIGVAGTLIGLVVGLVVAANAENLRAWISETIGIALFPPEVFFLSELPSKTDPVEVVFVVAMALILSFLASLYPAWRAAQYDPVEALRYG